MADQPLSTVLTPIQENQAMQDYVRQRLGLASLQQPNLALPQQPISPADRAAMMRPPLASGVGSPAPPPGLQVPGLDLTGEYGTGPRFGVPQGTAQLMYRRGVPF